jgi:hypothetical protein
MLNAKLINSIFPKKLSIIFFFFPKSRPMPDAARGMLSNEMFYAPPPKTS